MINANESYPEKHDKRDSIRETAAPDLSSLTMNGGGGININHLEITIAHNPLPEFATFLDLFFSNYHRYRLWSNAKL